ncbi:MAG: CpsD/CapB family tyrosine-protein kinase [Clostridiales bacterium]|nr:CpsD/CapB family tyrosine-protein kinase [Clostridiales bacterium]
MRRELIVQRSPKSPVAEVFRTLRTNIQFMNSKKSLKTLLITSTMPGEGKTWVASNLAVTFAQAGKKVAIVDADMRKGRLHKMFQIDAIPGLSNYLSGLNENGSVEEDILKYVRKTEVENLYVIPSGNVPPNPSELLASEATTNMLERLKEVFDIIILDGTPSLLVTDAVILSREADSTIIVTAHKATKKDGLQKVKKAIENVGGKIAGVVINKIPVNIEKYESTYYYSSSATREEKNNVQYEQKTRGKVSREKSDEIEKQLNDFLKNNKI